MLDKVHISVSDSVPHFLLHVSFIVTLNLVSDSSWI